MTQKFGSSDSSEVKLETVFDYANFYTKALSGNGYFRLWYVDAFAGSGSFSYIEDFPTFDGLQDFDEVIEGSARRALQVEKPFDRYLFSDVKIKNVRELSKLKTDFPHLADRIETSHLDANDLVREFCANMSPNDRALMFLDPFGNQVSFDTLKVIANTSKIDLWYLFPSWWGIARQVSNDGVINPDARSSITRICGSESWEEEVVSYREEPDLFNQSRLVAEKTVTVDSITRYMIGRMETIFDEGVSKSWLPIGKNGQPGFSLLFACANEKDSARKLALTVSKHVMTRK